MSTYIIHLPDPVDGVRGGAEITIKNNSTRAVTLNSNGFPLDGDTSNSVSLAAGKNINLTSMDYRWVSDRLK